MFFRWKKADLVTDLMWDWIERVESRSTPRLRTSGDGERVELSMVRRKSPTFLSRVLVANSIRFDDVQVFISRRQLTRDWGGGGQRVLC